MPKYKLLTADQLHALEKEFIEFLVINGIAADDWMKIKQNDLDKASRIIDLFSDVVYEQIGRSTQFMQIVYSDALLCFQFLENKLIMVGLKSSGDIKVDFSDSLEIAKIVNEMPSNIQIVQDESTHAEGKVNAVVHWLEKGAVKSDGSIFKMLYLAYAAL